MKINPSSSPSVAAPPPPPIDDEELADIQNYIMNDIVRGGEGSSSSNNNMSNIDSSLDEVSRLRRKEKHMAPIDCTGVSSAYGLTWHCRRCDRPHSCKSECAHYHGMHNPVSVVENNRMAADGLPTQLVIRGK